MEYIRHIRGNLLNDIHGSSRVWTAKQLALLPYPLAANQRATILSIIEHKPDAMRRFATYEQFREDCAEFMQSPFFFVSLRGNSRGRKMGQNIVLMDISFARRGLIDYANA